MYDGSAQLKRKWAAGKAVFGPIVQLPAPGVVEIFAHAGFDLVVIDLEYGPINLETAENMVRAANAAGVASAVRVFANTPEHISAALSLGVDAVVVPQVGSEAEAIAAVQAARFAPQGSRGVCPFVRAASYSADKDDGFYEKANDAVIVNVLLEGVEALANLDRMLEMPGLDAISLAPFDLSQSLGVTGQVDHPLVIEAVEDACRRAAGHGKAIGFVVQEPRAAGLWLARGVKWLTASVDTQLIYAAARSFAVGLQAELQVSGPA